jgi:hypothetical protein
VVGKLRRFPTGAGTVASAQKDPFRGFMKRIAILSALLFAVSISAVAAPLGTAARTVIPMDIQQIISVDYRALKASSTALALKEKVLPDNMKQFESALRGVGVNPDQDVEQLTFASFRVPKSGLRMVGIAQGTFAMKSFMKKMALKKIKPVKHRTTELWPMAGGMQMAFLDTFTILFGESSSVKNALDTRDGEAQSLTSNSQITDMIASVESGPVWSVLDQSGTQNMMRSALGEAASLADYNVVKKRLLGSRYTMDFQNGVAFDLSVVTSDTMTAATMSSLIKAGMMYRKMNAPPAEKMAMEGVTVNNDSSNLQLHFKTDDKKFQALLNTEIFAAMTK